MRRTRRSLASLIALSFWMLVQAPPLPHSAALPEGAPLAIDSVEVRRPVFNPSAGERVELRFQVSEKAEVVVYLLDALQEPIATLLDGEWTEEGIRVFWWDGRDRQGTIVPDEAYFVRIEARQEGRFACYDGASSSGLTHEITRITFLPELQRLAYSLPENGRVCIKAGIADGPLLAVPVDWEPRPEGVQQAGWDGFDRDGVIEVLAHPQYQLRGSYVALPKNTVFTTGNTKLTWREYNRAQSHRSAAPNPVASNPPASSLSPAASLSDSVLRSRLDRRTPFQYKSPALKITFPGVEGDEQGTPLLTRSFAIQTAFDPEWQPRLNSRLYEIYYFIDGVFLMEEPWLRLPHEGRLEVKEQIDGLHVLTVNVIHDDGQTGVKSMRVKFR
jgi:hypothetical protein